MHWAEQPSVGWWVDAEESSSEVVWAPALVPSVIEDAAFDDTQKSYWFSTDCPRLLQSNSVAALLGQAWWRTNGGWRDSNPPPLEPQST
jgi:hypothetical protein